MMLLEPVPTRPFAGRGVQRETRPAPHSPLSRPESCGHDLGVSLEQVYERYGNWIRRRVRHHLPDAWEDGVQEVLVKLQPALERMRETREEAVRALVSRTVRSVCIDELRLRARRPGAATTETAAAAEELADPASSGGDANDDAEEQAEVLARVAEIWNGLAERERQILGLRFRDGLSFREIAELLDVPQGSVAGWYSRAIARLRTAERGLP